MRNEADEDVEEEDDEEEEEEGRRGNRFLGFMFGNVDQSGGLDADYLDEDAKEHLAALGDKLDSLADIDLSKSSPSRTDDSEHEYLEKLENAIDFEDFDEKYDGPETQDQTEEDLLLPNKQYLASSVSLENLNKKSVFDEENYDDEEEEVVEAPGGIADSGLPDDESEGVQEGSKEQISDSSSAPLPVLYVEDGVAILRFSEIFGINEPLKKVDRVFRRRNNREWIKELDTYDIEEDEEVYLRGSLLDFSAIRDHILMLEAIEDDPGQVMDDIEQVNDSCLCAQPMKEDIVSDVPSVGCFPSPNFYPLDHNDWEGEIIWNNSPTPTSSNGCSGSRVSVEESSSEDDRGSQANDKAEPSRRGNTEISENTIDMSSMECRKTSDSTRRNHRFPPSRSGFPSEKDTYSAKMKVGDADKGLALHRFGHLSLQNKDLLDGSWLDQVIWDSDKSIPAPKFIYDLRDEQMLFEILDLKNAEHLQSHAGAALIVHSSKVSLTEQHDLLNQGMTSVGCFNFSNDKYYSNWKTTQQTKTHTKKRAFMGMKILHSVPALKLQMMEPKLSLKDIANFHRPKASWYPRDNEIAARAQGVLRHQGLINIVLLTSGGRGIKLHVDAEETPSSVKLKAAKKLDIKSSEKVKVLYSGKELEEGKSLAMQNVRPNSVLHILRTMIHLWPKAQKLPGENKPLRPPAAFKKKSDLSVKAGHVFLMEYCEERPLLLGDIGMGARLCTYYQKVSLGDQTAISLRNGNSGIGNVFTLEPADKSPFLADIAPGSTQSCLETNMYRAPIFQHKSPSTDYLLVRSAKGTISLRRIDGLYVVGQEEPHMKVPSPGSKGVQNYIEKRMLVHVYREFRAQENSGDFFPFVRADELTLQFPALTEASIRKHLKHCTDFKRGPGGLLSWFKRSDFRIPSEDELRRMLTPENVCCYESMQAGLYRLKRLGISKLISTIGLSSAMDKLPDEAVALAAASHIERELQTTSWSLSSNFVACTNQDRDNIERLEITGVGDPSGRGLGFSYVRATPKAPVSSTQVKKKAAATRGGPSVTGTDADLRRLSMEAAREVLLKFEVPEEQIEKMTRWHRIAMVRKLSSEQASARVQVDAMALNKFARGQRMPFPHLQQQTREKCQEIWDRQVQNLSATDGDEIESGSEENSDLDSFAGDLETLLDAEECEEEDDGHAQSRADKADGFGGLKMRRCPSHSMPEKEIEDDEAEAAYLYKFFEDDETELNKKRSSGPEMGCGSQLGPEIATLSKNAEIMFRQLAGNPEEVVIRNSNMVIKEKKQTDRPVREGFICGACGQSGHMRTNKNCPKYGEDADASEIESISGKSHPPDSSTQMKTGKKFTPKGPPKVLAVEMPAGDDRVGSKTQPKLVPVKFKFGAAENLSDRNLSINQVSDKQMVFKTDADCKATGKVNKIIISSKSKIVELQHEKHKAFVAAQHSLETGKEQSHKKIIFKQPKADTYVHLFSPSVDTSVDHEVRKTKKIAELSCFDMQRQEEQQWFAEEEVDISTSSEGKQWDEGKLSRFPYLEGRRVQEDQKRFMEFRRHEAIRREELQIEKNKKKKKKKIDFGDDYLEYKTYRTDRRFPERDRAAKRRAFADLSPPEHQPLTKRRRGGQVVLSNLLEGIVDNLKSNNDVSYLFLKPVTKKEAPDYFDIIKRPMDLSTIREKVRKMEYKSVENFRHDVWQITYNAHQYNDGRNPGIPPLADQLLELCDYLLTEKEDALNDAEEDIRNMDT